MLRIERSTNGQVVFTLVSATARRRDVWAAGNVRFAGRDARKPGRRDFSRRLRSEGDLT
jgi:hypothetical protein